jgi:hypothetical protein
MIRLLLGTSFDGSGIEGFLLLLQQNILPVTRAKQKENMIVK